MALVMTGLVNLFISGKRLILHSRSRMAAVELGKYFLDPLQMQVRQDQWGSNCLSQDGTSDCSMGTQAIGGITYTPSYERSAHPSLSNIRKVKLTLSWNEPAP